MPTNDEPASVLSLRVALAIVTSLLIMVGILLAAPELGISSGIAQAIAVITVLLNLWAWARKAG